METMCVKFFLFGYLSFMMFNAYSQKKHIVQGEHFSLKGNFVGNKTRYIVLSYLNSNKINIIDTCNIINGHIAFEGNVKEPTFAFLKADIASNIADDPNSVHFFLEPRNIKIEIVENNFRNLKLTGSKTQSQYDSLNRIELPIRENRAPLDSLAYKLADSVGMFLRRKDTISANNIANERYKIITIGIKPYKDSLNNIERKFIKNNPNSFLAPYLLYQQFKIYNWYKDSVRFYYAKLVPNVQSSYWGKEIKKWLSGILPLGSVLPNLQGTSNNDDNIMTDSLLKNNNYTLIIFWASWCAPCRQMNPTYANIYKEYHDKGLKFVAVTLDDDRKLWLEAIRKDNTFNWVHIFPNKSKSGMFDKYGLNSIPAEILLKGNIIIGKYAGADTNHSGIEDLEDKLKALFSQN